MKLTRLALERYGAFTDRVLTFDPDAALHIVHGANESGKTSALAAIGDLLFGFGARTAYNFRHVNAALRVGGTLLHSDGRQMAIRRRKGNLNTLLDEADQPLPDDTLAPWLGGLSRDSFDREFGLTAEALRRGGDELLKAGGRLAETLAASSAGLSALTRLKEHLQGEADQLFTARRASGKAFYIAADRRDEADRALRDSIVTRDALRQADDAAREAEARLAALNKAHGDSGKALARWQRTLRVRSRLARLDAVAVAHAALADLPAIPPATLAEWRGAVALEAEIAREQAGLDAAEAANATEIAALSIDETLLAQAAAIEALRDRMGAIRKDLEDLPRRRQARDTARAALDDGARRLALPSHIALLERLPTDAALARARDLIARRRQAEQAITEAEARHARLRRERDDFAAEHADAPALTDPAALKQRFDALGDIAAQADRLRRERAALALERDALAASLSRLDPSPGSLDDLRALPLPDIARIERCARDFAGSDDTMERLATALATHDDAIAAAESDLRRLSSAGTMPGRADLTEARRQRDAHLGALRDALDGDRTARDHKFAEVVQSSQAIDGITDLLLSDTERATRREDARQRLATHRAEQARIAAKRAEAGQARDTLDRAWRESWAAAGLTPRTPAEMLRWRERADDILQRLAKLDALGASLDAFATSLDAGKRATIVFLESLGRTPDRALASDILYREAALRLDELRTAWADAKARAASRQRIERDLREAEAARAAAHDRLADLMQAWPAAMAGIALAETASAAEAEATLAVWAGIAVPKAGFERESRSVSSMEADIAAFEHDVRDMVARIAPELAADTATDALARMWRDLDATRRASDLRARLREASTRHAAARQTLVARRAANAVLLDQARDTLRCAGTDALAVALDRLGTRQQLEDERATLHRDLAETGDGLDEAALRNESEGLDPDLLPGDIEREQIRQAQLLQDIAGASATLQQKRDERDGLLQGRNAHAAASERAQADAELLAIAERWLLRAAAARLAARAIEGHRARVQDPMIARAGELFASASDAAFAGLAIDHGEDDQPELKARRPGGERVGIAGLSEGTRDQLFLALRLALLERRGAEPLPFIGDDLLASFDETRTRATLRLLAAGGGSRQIILFTHHRHVVELARTLTDRKIDCVAL
ncbi:MAG: AAA family ATPase [Xanthobacteraceae bacterium]|nr:AAA family ATPase [Xanthobacteraceae bacterium]